MKTIIKKITWTLSLTVFFILPGSSQTNFKTVPNLKIGDTIPSILVHELTGSGARETSLSELYQPGLLLINFWATWCEGCMKELPLLDSMQRLFPARLNVLCVAYEDSSKIRKWMASRPDIPKSHLRIVAADQVLVKYFVHKLLPHNVWIDRNGVVRAITNEEEVTAENISAFLADKPAPMNTKKDNMHFDYQKPFHLGDSVFRYRSIITGYLDGIPGVTSFWSPAENKLSRYLGVNRTILDLFAIAFHRGQDYYKMDLRLLQVLTKDSSKFFYPFQMHNKAISERFKKITDWQRLHSYTYDLSLPAGVPDTLFYQYMINDFQRMFHVTFSEARKPMLCNVVKIMSGSKFNLASYRSRLDSGDYVNFFKNTLTLRHGTVKQLVTQILGTWKYGDDLWVDESGIGYPLDLVITFDATRPITLETIKQRLKDYGLVVEQQIRPYPVMVIRDLDN